MKGRTIKELLSGELGLVLMLGLLVVLFGALSDYFLQPANLLNITRQVSINLIVAVGVTFVILIGEIDLSVGSIAAIAGVATAAVLLSTKSFVLAILAGLFVGVAVGLVNGLLVVRGKMQSFIVTLAMMGLARGGALVWTNGIPISGLPIEFGALGAGYVGAVPVSTIVSLFVWAIAFVVLERTKHGTYLRAIGANREVARLSAIPVNRYRLAAFLVSGLGAALSGVVITSRLLSAQPVAATGMELNAIAAVVLGGASLSGGVGSALGTLLGAITIGIIDNGMNLVGVSAFWQQIVKGIIILGAVGIRRGD